MQTHPGACSTVALKLLWSEFDHLNHKLSRELYSSVRCDHLSAAAATAMCDWFGFTTVDASSPRCPKAVVYLFFLELCPYNLSTLMKSIPYGGDVAAAIATPQSLAARICVSILPVCRHRA